MPRRYYRLESLPALVDWLATEPGGQLQVLIGAVPAGVDAVGQLMGLLQREPETARWVVSKMQRGELEIRATPARADLPEGRDLPHFIVPL